MDEYLLYWLRSYPQNYKLSLFSFFLGFEINNNNYYYYFISQLSTGVFDATTAALVLEQLISDGYKDDGKVPPGYKFKVICLLAHRFVILCRHV